MRAKGAAGYGGLAIISLITCLIIWSLHSSGPRLKWWIGPAERLTARGERKSHWFQVRVQVPVGWELSPYSDTNDGNYLWQPPVSSYPRFLRWILPKPESDGHLSLLLRLPGYHGAAIDGGYPEGKEI